MRFIEQGEIIIMLKLIATDMDGTWLNDKKEFDHKLFKKIFNILQERNIKFVVSSGNQFENLRSRFPECANQLYYIAENGAFVAEGRQILNVIKIPAQDMKTIIKIVNSYNYPFIFAGLASAYVRKRDGEAYYQNNKKYFAKIEKIDNFENILDKDKILKVTCHIPHKKLKRYLNIFKNKYPEMEFVSGGGTSIDMQGKGMNKAVGLKYLGQRLGITSKEMIAFGDSGNDVGMLKFVGHSFATATALSSAKRAANEIIGSSNDSAVQLKLLDLLE